MDIAKNDRRWIEYDVYIHDNKLTKYERQLLRKWIRDGHSVYETVESEYLPGPAYPPMDFIQAYRLDRSISEDIKGMTLDEKEAYLKDLTGWVDPSPQELALTKAKIVTPEIVITYVRDLQRELFYLWCFVSDKGLTGDARTYIEENKDYETLGEW